MTLSSKLYGGRGVAVLLTAVLSTIIFANLAWSKSKAKPAVADAKTLVCNDTYSNNWPPLTIDLNEAESKIAITSPAWTSTRYKVPNHWAAFSSGPLPATFDSNTITFDRHDRDSDNFYQHFTINRLSGQLLYYTSINAPLDRARAEDQALFRYKCKVGKARF
jgi:hypothetical protein